MDKVRGRPLRATGSFQQVLATRRDRCAICDATLDEAIGLPALPMTDTYCREPMEPIISAVDQCLLYCEACGHGQLETLVAPKVLYGTNYGFRTSASATARKGTEFFLAMLDDLAPGRRFGCVLDVGCNDLHLLGRLANRADHRVGVDPLWSGREAEVEDKSVMVFGVNFEEFDRELLPAKPDLVVCRHTLEHIPDPSALIRALLEVAADDALYIIEVPGFDGLIERLRFDQVFHQHAQYFSLRSFLRLLEIVGGHHVAHRFNYHDWGAMAVAFTGQQATGHTSQPSGKTWSLSDIRQRWELFRRQMQDCGEALGLYADGLLYGYGAAQMLPVLGYHMGTDFRELDAILDDDPAKDGIGYWNLPVRIIASTSVGDLAGATVLITALDNYQPIMMRLLQQRPRHILQPLNVI